MFKNRFGLTPDNPSKILICGAIAFALIFLAVSLVSWIVELYVSSPRRIAGFSICAVLLFLPQVVFLPANPTYLMGAVAGSFIVWSFLVKSFFNESLPKGCLLLIGSACVLMLMVVAG